jgi:hypothetical protein
LLEHPLIFFIKTELPDGRNPSRYKDIDRSDSGFCCFRVLLFQGSAVTVTNPCHF